MTQRAMTLRLDPSQAEALEAIARVDRMPVSEAVRDAIAAHIEARRADPEFLERLKQIIERDRELLARLVPESDVAAASAQRAVAGAKAASSESAKPAVRRRGAGNRPARTPEAGESSAPDAEASQVLKLVTEQSGMTTREIASALNIPAGSVAALLTRLKRQGQVNRIRGGWVRRELENYQM